MQVALQIENAVSQGAKLLKGGRRLQGSFVEPTLLTDVTTHMLCMKEETFGPLVPIVRLVAGKGGAGSCDSVFPVGWGQGAVRFGEADVLVWIQMFLTEQVRQRGGGPGRR